MTRPGDAALPVVPPPPHTPISEIAQKLHIGIERLPGAAYTYDDADEETVIYENVAPTPPPLFSEAFNDLTRWTGSGTLVAGRNGTAVQVSTSSGISTVFAPADEYVTVGAAWRTLTANTNQRGVFELWGATNTNRHLRLYYNGTTAQSFSILDQSATVLGTTATGLLAPNTWAYIELQARIHDTAGSATVRLNGAQVLALTGMDTKGGAVGTVDALRLSQSSGVQSHWDDLYLGVGATFPFLGDQVVP